MKRMNAAISYRPRSEKNLFDVPDRLNKVENIRIKCYENHIPPFAEAELERLYESIFSSLPRFRIYGGAGGHTSTYVVTKGEKIITVFLFRREKGKVRVLNEVIMIPAAEIKRFANYIFGEYPSVNAISFHAVQAEVQGLGRPYQRFNCLEDIVVTLPATPQEYLNSLSQNMRRTVKRYTERLNHVFPSFVYSVSENKQIDRQQIRDIVKLNWARMAKKNKASVLTDLETDRIIALTEQRGMVGAITIDGRVRAGSICYRIGNNYFMSVVAHDPDYDDYRIGTMCVYLTICECIRRGGKELHFLWGKYDYKFSLLGVEKELYQIDLHRSVARLILNGDMVAKALLGSAIRQATLWLKKDDRKNKFILKCVKNVSDGFQSAIRLGMRLIARRR